MVCHAVSTSRFEWNLSVSTAIPLNVPAKVAGSPVSHRQRSSRVPQAPPRGPAAARPVLSQRLLQCKPRLASLTALESNIRQDVTTHKSLCAVSCVMTSTNWSRKQENQCILLLIARYRNCTEPPYLLKTTVKLCMASQFQRPVQADWLRAGIFSKVSPKHMLFVSLKSCLGQMEGHIKGRYPFGCTD